MQLLNDTQISKMLHYLDKLHKNLSHILVRRQKESKGCIIFKNK